MSDPVATEPASSDLEIWGIDFSSTGLTGSDIAYLETLPKVLPTVEWVWSELDRVWDDMGLDNRRPLSSQPIGEFYGHPCWIMNGLFSAADPTSRGHRLAIAEFIKQSGAKSIADYGSGFGELSRLVAESDTHCQIKILNVEPFPRQSAIERLSHLPMISWVDSLTNGSVDVIVAQDVLEHVEDPLALAVELCRSARKGGVAIFANAFHPMIKCHLPATFAYRHTFTLAMRTLGCRPQGAVPGAAHALVFEVPEELRETRLKVFLPFIRLLGNARNALTQAVLRPIRKTLRNVTRRVGVGLL